MLTYDESLLYCGNLFHSSIILFEKNVFRVPTCRFLSTSTLKKSACADRYVQGGPN